MRFENTTFTDQDVAVDGNEYEGCRFENCNIIYRGSGAVSFTGCSFGNHRITFKDGAASTIGFMQSLYHGGWEHLIEATFDNIRRGDATPDDDVLNSGIIH